MGKLVEKTQCPSCAKAGRDKSGNNLAVYEDGSTFCFSCRYSDRGGDRMTQTSGATPTDISRYASYPMQALQHKPIAKEIAEEYGVRSYVNVETGKQEGILYPYYSDGNLVGYKARRLPKQFSYKGSSEDIGLFGHQLFKKGGNSLVIVEGEDDALSARQMLLSLGKSVPVVSIPNGADANGTIDAKIKKTYDYITSFKQIFICLDNDSPGRVTAEAMAEWLVSATKVKTIQLPEGYKDASDLLIAEKPELFLKCLSEASEYSPEGIIDGTQIDLQGLKESPQKGYSSPYTGLDDKLKGFRKGELTLLTAGSGIGKSTIARELGYHMIKEHGLKIANIFLEEPMEKTALGYVALDNNVPLSSLWMNRKAIPEDSFDNSFNELVNNGRNFFLKHFGSMSNDALMAKMRYYANALDVDFIYLDHISMVISGQENDNERKSIDLLMTSLAAFCNETGVGVIAVVHLKRKNGGGKDKSLNEGGQVSLTDLRGSGGLEQLSWSVVALERNQQDAEESNFSTVRVLKNRIFGFTGECGRLFFDPTTGRLLEAPEPIHYAED